MTRSEITDFYNKYKGHLYNTSMRIVGNSMDAEEVVQDTILKYLRFEKDMVVQQEEAWLVKTCVRGSIDVLRKRKAGDEFIEGYKEDMSQRQLEDTGNQLWGELKTSASELAEKIKKGMASLPDGYRSILSMILFEGYDYQEVSDIMRVKEATVRSQYMRGKIKLAELIKGNDVK